LAHQLLLKLLKVIDLRLVRVLPDPDHVRVVQVLNGRGGVVLYHELLPRPLWLLVLLRDVLLTVVQVLTLSDQSLLGLHLPQHFLPLYVLLDHRWFVVRAVV